MNDRPSARQTYQWSSSLSGKFGSTGKLILYTYCTSMLWSIDGCQNRISADQYHLTVPRAQVSTHRGRVLFWSYPLTNYQFQMIAGSSLFFPRIHIKYVVFMSLWPRTIRILISNWPRTRKFSQFFKNTGGKTISYHGHALVTLCVQFLCSDWSKFDRWVHAENLCSILKLVYFDSWSWHSFVSTCDVLNCLFLLDVQNEIQLLSSTWKL